MWVKRVAEINIQNVVIIPLIVSSTLTEQLNSQNIAPIKGVPVECLTLNYCTPSEIIKLNLYTKSRRRERRWRWQQQTAATLLRCWLSWRLCSLCFSSLWKSLTSLDLSYNELDGIPFAALKELRNLQWINLHGYVFCCSPL